MMIARRIYVGAKRHVFKSMPEAVRRRILRRQAPALLNGFDGLTSAKAITDRSFNSKVPGLVLANGTTLLGQMPSRFEATQFAPYMADLGFGMCHARVCVDYVTRYLYPHMAAGFQKLDSPAHHRRYFHPQHFNLAQECDSFSPSTKRTIFELFSPQKNWTVLDVGAYLGYGSLWMLNEVGVGGKVLSVEAVKKNFTYLARHQTIRKASNWEIYRKAIWDRSDEEIAIQVSERQANAADPTLVPQGRFEKVLSMSLPELLERAGSNVDFLSLTVNGAELEALIGLKNAAPRKLPRRMLVPGWYAAAGKPRADSIQSIVEQLGYQIARTPGNLIYAWRS